MSNGRIEKVKSAVHAVGYVVCHPSLIYRNYALINYLIWVFIEGFHFSVFMVVSAVGEIFFSLKQNLLCQWSHSVNLSIVHIAFLLLTGPLFLSSCKVCRILGHFLPQWGNPKWGLGSFLFFYLKKSMLKNQTVKANSASSCQTAKTVVICCLAISRWNQLSFQ